MPAAAQERVSQRMVEQIVQVPVPNAQEEVMLVPEAVNHHRRSHGEVEQTADIHVPSEQKERSIHEEQIVEHPAERPAATHGAPSMLCGSKTSSMV